MGDIRAQIESRRRGEISGELLLRGLVGHENWMFFVAQGGVEKLGREGGVPDYVVEQDESGGKGLNIFSDVETLKAYIQNSGVTEWRCEVMASAGADIFSTLPGHLSSITIDPLTPHSVSYGREQFETLRRLADAAFMERELKALSDGSIRDQAGLDRVISDFRRYENFHLVSFLKADGEWTYPRYAADDGLNWVVACTALDNANLYLSDCATRLPGRYRIERLTGLNLAKIAVALGSPGVLFNWHGYVAPLMLNSQFLRLVCEAQ